MPLLICQHCEESFEGQSRRRYCCHWCYVMARKGYKHSEESKLKMRLARLAYNPMKGAKHTEEAKAKMRAAYNVSHETGERAVGWKGGRNVDAKGYVWIYSPLHPHNVGKYVLEHRLVMEDVLGRYLTDEEVVHHENEDKEDNRLDNLRLFASQAEHARYHRLKEMAVGMGGTRSQTRKKLIARRQLMQSRSSR
jgi:hypothetical protein